MQKIDRYPGLRSFTATESTIFLGREKETSELLEIIRNEQMLLLHSESGVGKSSLLSAGLYNKLFELDYLPIWIRFQKNIEHEREGNDVCLNIIRDDISRGLESVGNKRRVIFDSENPRLWEFVKSYQISSSKILIFIFDQFEEFFLFSENQRELLLLELSELLHASTPSRILDFVLNLPGERSDEVVSWSKQPNVKAIFSIRSDKVSFIKDIEYYLPLISFNQLKLLPLQRSQAVEAIQKPAAAEDYTRYTSAPFLYDKNVLDDILWVLTDKQGNIDSTQLQIVCSYIENKIKNDPIPWGRDKKLVVDSNYIGGREVISEIIENFYVDQLVKLNPGTKESAQLVIEEYLVSGGLRVSLSRAQIYDRLDSDTVGTLIDSRLIRIVHTHLGETYELTHDSLIRPVEKERKRRYSYLQEQESLSRHQAELRLQRDQFRKLLLVAVLIILFLSPLGYFYYRQRQTSGFLKRVAKKGAVLDSILKYNYSGKQGDHKTSGQYMYDQGLNAFRFGDYRNSLTYFANSQFLFSEIQKSRADELDTLLSLCQVGLRANLLFQSGDLDSAIFYYNRILKSDIYVAEKGSHIIPFPRKQIIEANNAIRVWSDFKTSYFASKKNEVVLDTITKIELNGKNLTTLPKEIYQCRQLRRLILNNNKFTRIPTQIFDFDSLLVLYFTNNKLVELPPTIGQLSALTSLGLNNNFISVIPDEIGDLRKLKYLWIQYNSFQRIPKKLADISTLETIVLSNNGLEGFPVDLLRLPNLKRLYLNNTGIYQLPPDSLFRQSRLTYLEIACNPVTNKVILMNNKGNRIKIYRNCEERKQILPLKDTLPVRPLNLSAFLVHEDE